MNKFETDIHLHLDGSISLEILEHLAALSDVRLDGKKSRHSLTVGQDCKSLADYLHCFELPGKLLQTKEALSFAAADLVGRLAASGLLYAEIRFAPQLHTARGLTQEQAVEAVAFGVRQGCEKFDFHAGVILCAMVGGSLAANQETIELAKAYLGRGVVAADIAGNEAAMKEMAQPLFRNAYQMDLPFTIHAGETGSYENVAAAVALGARRIGHGWGAIRSEEVMKLLESEGVTLEMCVTSNLQTKGVASVMEHPIRTFYDRGISVTYNTDNMTVSGTDLKREAGLLCTQLGFTDRDLLVMNRYALEAAFVGEQEREFLLEQLELCQ